MAEAKYLITVDSDTGKPKKLEKVGEGGELTSMDLSKLNLKAVPPAHTSLVMTHEEDNLNIQFPMIPPGNR